MAKKQKKDTRNVVTTNRRALGKFKILETLEAGIVLTGPEVKSLRAKAANIQEGFVRIENGEAFLWNAHISFYKQGSDHVEQEPLRTRKLLLNQSEIRKWDHKTKTQGLTIVPLEIFFSKRGKAKVKIGLVKGKRVADRREDLKRRTVDREIRREFAGKQRIR